MITPDWVLTISFWLHMIATVLWIGGLAILSLLIYPIAKKILDKESFSSLIYRINKRFNPIAWFGLTVLTVTGLIQMAANINYEGYLKFENLWSGAMLGKHAIFIFIIGISAYQSWSLNPEIERAALKRHKGLASPKSDIFQDREKILIRVNLFLGLLVLLLTAIARIS